MKLQIEYSKKILLFDALTEKQKLQTAYFREQDKKNYLLPNRLAETKIGRTTSLSIFVAIVSS